MSHEKEVLQGVVTLAMNVKTADGILDAGAYVKISGENEVEECDANHDNVFGYVLVPNKETSGKCTVVTRGKRVLDMTTGAAYVVGSFLNFTSASKAIAAAAARATATFTVVSHSNWENDETVTVNGKVLTAGTDFTVGTSVAASALSLASAINNLVPGVKASAAAGVVTIECLDAGVAGNAFTLATTAIADEGTVSGALFTGGREFWPMGMALEAASAGDQTKSVLMF